MDPTRIHGEFPAPTYRGYQEAALDQIKRAYADGNDVVLVRAPTGSGKSLLARAIAGCAAEASADLDEDTPTGAYYTTPQVSQIDDVAEDPLLDDFNVLRGKSNYDCIHPEVSGDVPVHEAPCNLAVGFTCDIRDECPYYMQRTEARGGRFAAMTLAYFMQTAMVNGFDDRDVVVIDEAHGLSKWAEMHGAIELSPDTIPNWSQHRPAEITSLTEAAQFAGHVTAALDQLKETLSERDDLDPMEANRLRQARRLLGDLKWFLNEYQDAKTETRWLYEQPGGDGSAVTIKPVNPERLLYHTLWDRGNKFALLSATILSRSAFCREVALDQSRVALVDIDHTFPVENRPLFDVMQGKMTWEHRDETLPKIAETIATVMDVHSDTKGLVHCHSYDIQDRLAAHLRDTADTGRIRTHRSDTREQELAAWKQTNEPEVFLSVKMEEALDLKGDLARWQVLTKVPYPNTNDPQVSARVEDEGDWAWYFRTALGTVIQAAGRIIRAPDDYGATYIADSSFEDLFNRTRGVMPSWFREQVERLEEPPFATQ